MYVAINALLTPYNSAYNPPLSLRSIKALLRPYFLGTLNEGSIKALFCIQALLNLRTTAPCSPPLSLRARALSLSLSPSLVAGALSVRQCVLRMGRSVGRRQHTSACVSIRQHTHVQHRLTTPAYVRVTARPQNATLSWATCTARSPLLTWQALKRGPIARVQTGMLTYADVC
jgi:hypothetical protein